MKNDVYRVLLIEDDVDHAALITRQLKHAEGCCLTVVHVTSIQFAIETAASQHFDVVLMEVNLPDSDPRENALESSSLFPSTPIVILTSLSDMSIAKQAIDQGVDDYLVKTELSGSLICKSVLGAIQLSRLKQENRDLRSELHDCKEAMAGALLS